MGISAANCEQRTKPKGPPQLNQTLNPPVVFNALKVCCTYVQSKVSCPNAFNAVPYQYSIRTTFNNTALRQFRLQERPA